MIGDVYLEKQKNGVVMLCIVVSKDRLLKNQSLNNGG